MEKELEAQIHLFKSDDDLKGHALDLANRRGNSYDTHLLTDDTIEFQTESGELCKLERQDGKWVPSRSNQNRNPKTYPDLA